MIPFLSTSKLTLKLDCPQQTQRAQDGPPQLGRRIVEAPRHHKALEPPPTPSATPALDLLDRNFAATAPDRFWTVDITYVKTDEGFPYLAFVFGVYSRRIVGWSMASHLGTGLVVDALEMAAWRRKPAAGLVYHSDRGTRYTALSFGKRLEEVGIVPSIGRTGSRRWTTPPRRVSCPHSNADSSIAGAFPPGRPQGVPSSSTWRRLQPKEAALLARLREPRELLGAHGEGGCRGVARKRPPNRCNSRRGFGRGVTVLALLSSKMIRTEERAGQERRGDGQGQGPRHGGRRGGGGSQTQDATGQAADQASQTVENGGGGETPNATEAAEQKAEELGVDLS
ncbi:hypothetical protein BH20ACT11_BH20ACT11_09360 [soil metagenome]